MKRTYEQLKNIHNKQIKLLESSCTLFDAGNENEALRIATIIRVLVHDTDKSKSLLLQLQIKNKIKFLDSSLPIDPVPINSKENTYHFQGLPGLVGIRVHSLQANFIAPLIMREDTKGSVSFDEWWTKECIPADNNKRYSRKKLILWMANKEGGAHVDENIDLAYKELCESNLGMTFLVGGIKKDFGNSPADASVRQIAWELLESIKSFNFP